VARCGCAGGTCQCLVQEGAGISVSGSGSAGNPYVVAVESGGGDIGGLLTVQDSATMDLALTGSGTTVTPYVLSAQAVMSLDELDDVSAGEPVPNGYVLAKSGTQWQPVPPSTASPGAVATDTPVLGDGSSGSHVRLLVDPAGLLATTGAGLKLADTQRAAAGVTPVSLSNQATKAVAVTFPASRFTSAPAVVANVGSNTQTYGASTANRTATGFTLNMFHKDGVPSTVSNVDVNWIANAIG
jgi:hypothetical protein